MSTFGTIFRVTTFGESHCKGVGCVIDGVPPGLNITEEDIQPQLTRRRPGQSRLTTPRDEKDQVTILSGTEFGRTLGTPMALLVPNENVRPQDYKEMSVVPRPGHADYTYQVKYGIRASSGGGRSSARETIGRVAAGTVAEKWLRASYKTEVVAFVASIGDIELPEHAWRHPTGRPWTRKEVDEEGQLQVLRNPSGPAAWRTIPDIEHAGDAPARAAAQLALDTQSEDRFVQDPKEARTEPAYKDFHGNVFDRNGVAVSSPPTDLTPWLTEELVPVRCPHAVTACQMATLIRIVKSEHDSIGGSTACVVTNVPVGLGEPCFDKLEAKLAHAMLSLPATKGFEIGSGFAGSKLRGSAHNDMFTADNTKGSPFLKTKTNHAGGTLGGITHGADITFRVAVKPVSTIGRAQDTADFDGKATVLEAKGRHDPCVLPRTPPLLEAMTALVLADAALIQRTRLGDSSTAVTGSFEVDPIAAAKLNDEGPATKKLKTDEEDA